MRMTDGHGKRICSIFRQWLGGMQQYAYHMLYLLLVCPAESDHSLLHFGGGIGRDTQAGIRTCSDQCAARLSQFQRRIDIFRYKHIFNGSKGGVEFRNHQFQPAKEYVQAIIKVARTTANDAVMYMADAVALYINNTNTGFQ